MTEDEEFVVWMDNNWRTGDGLKDAYLAGCAAGVKAEREACARLVDAQTYTGIHRGLLAIAIRARQ